jgi:transposase
VERLRPEERRRLRAALAADPSLAKAWALKEGLRALYQSPNATAAETALAAWLREAEASGLAPFQRVAGTLRRWRVEVLNYWRYPITNAMVEGKHNRVKVLKRRAYGYRNDRNFMLRILNLIHTK